MPAQRSTTAISSTGQFLGYGGHFSGDVKPGWFGWAKDDFLFSFVAGDGIGNYSSGGWSNRCRAGDQLHRRDRVRDAHGRAARAGMAASNVLFKPIFAYSANGGYQHWWTPNLRSTIAAGIAHQDVSSQLIGPTQANSANKELWNAFVNLVWNPVAFITTGVQYMYGHRVVVVERQGQ